MIGVGLLSVKWVEFRRSVEGLGLGNIESEDEVGSIRSEDGLGGDWVGWREVIHLV